LIDRLRGARRPPPVPPGLPDIVPPVPGAQRLTVDGVSKSFGGRRVLKQVTMAVRPGEIVGLVGMSGSGKSTLANCILGLQRPDAGTISWRDRSLADRATRQAARREIQPVFQDPRSSMNPRWTVRRILGEPLENFCPTLRGAAREARLLDLLDAVALTRDHLDRNPHELSTGQCQRVCLARALAPDPALLILDEPLSALDVSVQATMLALLRDLHRQGGMGYLFISHDIAVVAELCQTVLVLQGGAIVEEGTVAAVLGAPMHPFTQSLLRDTVSLPVWGD
jgi:ABC-type dipeptide/oligopeptide/nickel transport system ATPase subunit